MLLDKNYGHLGVSALQTGPIQGNNQNMTEHRKKTNNSSGSRTGASGKNRSHSVNFVMLSRRTVIILLECKLKDTQTA